MLRKIDIVKKQLQSPEMTFSGVHKDLDALKRHQNSSNSLKNMMTILSISVLHYEFCIQ